MENRKSMAPGDKPVAAFQVGQAFEIEQVIDVALSVVDSTGEAADGFIRDLEPIPPLKELRILWNKSITRLLPARR